MEQEHFSPLSASGKPPPPLNVHTFFGEKTPTVPPSSRRATPISARSASLQEREQRDPSAQGHASEGQLPGKHPEGGLGLPQICSPTSQTPTQAPGFARRLLPPALGAQRPLPQAEARKSKFFSAPFRLKGLKLLRSKHTFGFCIHTHAHRRQGSHLSRCGRDPPLHPDRLCLAQFLLPCFVELSDDLLRLLQKQVVTPGGIQIEPPPPALTTRDFHPHIKSLLRRRGWE